MQKGAQRIKFNASSCKCLLLIQTAMKIQKYRTYTIKLCEASYNLLNRHLEAGLNKNKAVAYLCKICDKSQKNAEMFLRDIPKAKHKIRIPANAKTQQILDACIKKYGFEQHAEYILQFCCTTKPLK